MDRELMIKQAQIELARRELARRNFVDFVPYVNPRYEMEWFHRMMATKLDMVLHGKIKKLALFIPAQHGKAVSVNELCLTTKGWKKHGYLQIGDYVFGQDGKPKKVLGNSGAYKWPVSRITFSDGTYILASPEHEWALRMPDGSTIVKETKDLPCFINPTIQSVYKSWTIKSVEPAGETIVNCIQVEGGMYLAGQDLIPTHNSELASRMFPSYAIGRNPSLKIAVTSYAADLAEGFNKSIQTYISSEEYRAVFPKIRIPTRGEGVATGSRLEPMIIPEHRAHKWRKALGYILAVGVGGGITGKTVDIAIIDDPIKGRESANSVTIRDKVWDWYVDEVQTRLHNDAAQILIQTRWHEDDLAGRILAKHGYYSPTNTKGWDVIVFPALRTADINDYDPRSEGEALWPKRHNRDRILDIKADNIVTFDSLYQQDPKPNTDTLVYSGWKEIPEFPDEKDLDAVFYGLDFGFSNDPTALVKIGKSGRRIYLDELIYERGLGPHALRKKMIKVGVSRFREIFADHEPAIIHDLKHPVDNNGNRLTHEEFHVLKAVKEIEAGISTVKEFEIFYTARSVNIKMEKNKYAWKYVGGQNTNEPIDAWNHCFTGDTLVATKDGHKRIDSVTVGDMALTSEGYKRIVNVFWNGPRDIWEVRFKFDGKEIDIKATPDHKFKTIHGWVELKYLTDSDILYTTDKFTSPIEEIIILDKKKEYVYDIEVDEMHEYFANGILVHNCMDAIRYGLHTKYRRMSNTGIPIIWDQY